MTTTTQSALPTLSVDDGPIDLIERLENLDLDPIDLDEHLTRARRQLLDMTRRNLTHPRLDQPGCIRPSTDRMHRAWDELDRCVLLQCLGENLLASVLLRQQSAMAKFRETLQEEYPHLDRERITCGSALEDESGRVFSLNTDPKGEVEATSKAVKMLQVLTELSDTVLQAVQDGDVPVALRIALGQAGIPHALAVDLSEFILDNPGSGRARLRTTLRDPVEARRIATATKGVPEPLQCAATIVMCAGDGGGA